MKKITLLLLILLTSMIGYSQLLDSNWTNRYEPSSTGEVKIAAIANSKYIITQKLNYMEINEFGDSLNSGTFNSLLSPNGLKVIESDNGALFLGGVLTGDPTLIKLDSNYNTIWSTSLFSQSYARGVSAIMFDGNDIYVCGSYQSQTTFISKLSSLGDTIWNTVIPQTTFSNLTSIIKLNDGNFLASGNVDDYPLAIKFDSNGNVIWSYTETIFISFSKMSAFERTNGEIVLIPRNKFVVLSSAGQAIDTTDLYNNYYDIEERGDTVYLFGSHKVQNSGGPQYPYVHVMNKNLDSLDGFIYDDNVDTTSGPYFSRAVSSCVGGFVAAGLMTDASGNIKIVAAQFNDNCITTSVSEEVLGTDIINIYPNPSNGEINLQGDKEIVNVAVYNLLGKQVLSKTINANEAQLNLEHLPKGMYVVNLVFEEGSLSKKLILE